MKTRFSVTGMSCAACSANVERTVRRLPGVREVSVNLLAASMSVVYDERAVAPDEIAAAVVGIGYGAVPLSEKRAPAVAPAEGEERGRRARLIASLGLLLVLMYVAMGGMIGLPMPPFLVGMENALLSAALQFLLCLPILVLNRRFFSSGIRATLHFSPNMDTLVSLGAFASVGYGVYALVMMAYGQGTGNTELVHSFAHNLYFESGAMILTLVSLGKYFEARSKRKTTAAIEKLVTLAPKTARVLRDGREEEIPTEEICVDDLIVIRPGDRIPVDGVIVQGKGTLDQSAITGESVPVFREVGDEVISATVNRGGSFLFRATRVGEDTTLSQILRLVEEAAASRAPIARLADRVSAVFVPAVLAISLVTLAVWLILEKDFAFALNCAVSVLVISCPCALGLATPVAIMVGTGRAAECGILMKSAEAFERLHAVDTVVFDKTGTLTLGAPSVTDLHVFSAELSERDFLLLAASVESGSEHPLATAIVAYARGQGIAPRMPEETTVFEGRGIAAKIDGRDCLAGNLRLFIEEGIVNEDGPAAAEMAALSAEGKTPVLFSRDGKLLGLFAVADPIREDAKGALAALHGMHLTTVLLTGDNRKTAEAIGALLPLDEIRADLLPQDKERIIRELQASGHRVAMVGDGINDAPALSRADVGIAIGTGTDVAIDSADILLVKSTLFDVVDALRLSRAVLRNIRTNLFWAFFYNSLGIPLAAGALYYPFGLLLSPMIGSAAMSFSSVSVVLNALRLRRFCATPTVAATEEEPTCIPCQINEMEKKEMKKQMQIDGMMCEHCKAHVIRALSALDGVASVEVDLAAKTATLTLAAPVADETLSAAVTDAGYTPISVTEL